jgi:hypothetical protein
MTQTVEAFHAAKDSDWESTCVLSQSFSSSSQKYDHVTIKQENKSFAIYFSTAQQDLLVF